MCPIGCRYFKAECSSERLQPHGRGQLPSPSGLGSVLKHTEDQWHARHKTTAPEVTSRLLKKRRTLRAERVELDLRIAQLQIVPAAGSAVGDASSESESESTGPRCTILAASACARTQQETACLCAHQRISAIQTCSYRHRHLNACTRGHTRTH